MRKTSIPDYVAKGNPNAPLAGGIEAPILTMNHKVEGVDQPERVYNMAKHADREQFLKFASWATRNDVSFICTPL